MPAAVAASRSRRTGSTPLNKSNNDAQPPAKKQRLSQSTPSKKSAIEGIIPQEGRRKKSVTATPKSNGISKDDGRINKVAEDKAHIGAGDEGEDVDMKDVEDSNAIVISSAEEESDDTSDEEELQFQTPATSKPKQALLKTAEEATPTMTNGVSHHNDEESDADMGAEEDSGEDKQLSFGEILARQAPEEAINVNALIDPNADTVKGPDTSRALMSAPTATTLTTVLTQALRTNDRDLLESCFHMNELDSVRATIEKLDSTLVGQLLERLAERLHKRPGRAANLMVWVQWSLVSHGGYLAGNETVAKKLRSLDRVLKERAQGLQPLLMLKGRLDMLSAQLELRRGMQKQAKDVGEDDEAYIYVEGDESDKDEDQKQITGGAQKKLSRKEKKAAAVKRAAEADADAEEEDDMPATAEMDEDDEDEAESEDDDDEEDLLDTEAEETDNDEDDEEESDDEEVDGEVVDGADDDSVSDSDAPPSKKTKEDLLTPRRR